MEKIVQKKFMSNWQNVWIYGKNLDALYDCLTEISRDTCIGLFYDPNAKNAEYIEKILCVCYDAEEENEHIAIISSQLSDNV